MPSVAACSAPKRLAQRIAIGPHAPRDKPGRGRSDDHREEQERQRPGAQ
jgi:hypothetical protein